MPGALRNLCRVPPTWHGLTDPFDPDRGAAPFGRLSARTAGPLWKSGTCCGSLQCRPSPCKRVWLASHRSLPSETRNYVAIVTGWTADEWASPSPPQNAETTIPQGVPCTRLANLILAPKQEAQQIAAYFHTARWGVRLGSPISIGEPQAWEIYRERQKRFASLIGDRAADRALGLTPLPGMGRAISATSPSRSPTIIAPRFWTGYRQETPCRQHRLRRSTLNADGRGKN